MWYVRKESTGPDVDTLVRNTVSGHVTQRTESVPHVLLDGWDPNAWKVNKKKQKTVHWLGMKVPEMKDSKLTRETIFVKLCYT